MAVSYFTPYANATLTFAVPDPAGVIVIDPDTGNEKRTPRIVVVTASLKESKLISGTSYNPTPGSDTLQIRLTGYIVTPFPYLPDEIESLMVADAVVSGREGKFRIERVTKSPYGDTEIVGEKIKGVFYD